MTDGIDGVGRPLAQRLAHVQQNVSDAARAAGRDPAEITTIVVTKFQPASLVRELVELGVRDVGENRAQEAAMKASELAGASGPQDVLRWHFIGQLQRNKAKLVRSFASSVHSVDRPAAVEALSAVEDGSDEVGGPADGVELPPLPHPASSSASRTPRAPASGRTETGMGVVCPLSIR